FYRELVFQDRVIGIVQKRFAIIDVRVVVHTDVDGVVFPVANGVHDRRIDDSEFNNIHTLPGGDVVGSRATGQIIVPAEAVDVVVATLAVDLVKGVVLTLQMIAVFGRFVVGTFAP